MIDLSPAQAATRITTLLDTPENRTLDFKRIGAICGKMSGWTAVTPLAPSPMATRKQGGRY